MDSQPSDETGAAWREALKGLAAGRESLKHLWRLLAIKADIPIVEDEMTGEWLTVAEVSAQSGWPEEMILERINSGVALLEPVTQDEARRFDIADEEEESD